MFDTLLLFLAIGFAIMLPGWLIVRLSLGQHFTALERVLYAFALGLTLTNALLLILDRINLSLTWPVLALAYAAINALLGGILWYRHRNRRDKKQATSDKSLAPKSVTGHLSPVAWGTLLLMLFLAIGIKAYYLIPAGLPTATDMGHHMYWSDYITERGTIPTYEKIEVVVDPATGTASVSDPKPIADFIIGEHLPFAAIAILSGLSFVSSFPAIFLLIVHIGSLLALLALVIRLGEKLCDAKLFQWFVLSVFLFIGPLAALASPMARFVSGGVVGNIFGNFFIPLVILALYLGLRERSSRLVTLSIVLLATLAYTHHLSTLVLGFVVIGIALMACLTASDRWAATWKSWFATLVRPAIGIAFGSIILFALLVALPSYLDTRAIDSALGSPTKTTRTGLSFLQVSNSVGIVRTALALAGFVILAWSFTRLRERDGLAWATLMGWGGMLAIMAMRPDWVLLDIPSNRVGSYLVYPASLLAGYALAWTWERLQRDGAKRSSQLVALSLIGIILANGLFENGSALLDRSKAHEAQEVFAASRYLAARTPADTMILKDHNYLAADAWMKLFFLRDYGYPLSRGLFTRYSETGNRRERCTLVMIASPNGDEAKRCFDSTGTEYVVVNPTYDAIQFEKSPDFAKVYSSDHVAVFKRR